MKFSDDIKYIKGVGEARALAFRSIGVSTVGELLRFYPRAYEDWSKILPISQCLIGENVCIKGTVMFPVKNERVRGGMLIAKATITDGDDVIAATFFNNKYIEKMLKSGEEYLFYGKLTLGKFSAREMVTPMFVKSEKSVEIRPIYPQNKTITTKIVQSAVENALKNIDAIPDYLPDYILKKFNLVSLDRAIRDIHFPKDDTSLQNARDRLIFDELFILQLSLLTLKNDNSTVKTGNIIEKDYSEEFFGFKSINYDEDVKPSDNTLMKSVTGQTPVETVVCALCGIKTERTGRNQKFCPDCAKKKQRQRNAEFMSAKRSRVDVYNALKPPK